MYGGSGKLGRGGGGGVGRGAKRLHSPFHPPPSGRPIGAAGRLSIGASAARNRHSGAAPAAAPSTREETFSLVSGDPLAFAMIIRLAPNLVDEIRRVEAQGGTARIKFDSNANNASGNVIDVGGKDFRFTWSHEPGDLCDIYEERQSGEDGNGLLVEAGGAWRKLNVQRILDESTKNHVKMRSEEAERKLKSRKAIVLDHGNPSVKNQMKTLAAAAVEMNTRRMPFKQKNEPAFKKRKVEPAQGGVAPKSAFKLGLSSTTTSKGRLSVSPAPSPPEQLGASTSPIGAGNSTRSQIGAEEVIATQVNNNETAIIEKEMPTRAVEATVTLGNKGALPMDLQSMLIALLLGNPKGMSLKALEKAIGDSIPNCAKKIEPIIKKIANFQAPGRYILRRGVELESLKKPPSESGSSPNFFSSPEYARDQTSMSEKPAMEELEQQSILSPKLEESNQAEKIGIQQNSPDPFCDKKASDHSDGHAGSSSESGSDSDSESDSGSDSGSGSGSQSRSPVGSGSGSSSDSESDGSSSNKEGSDVDVDIMTSDDDKEDAKHKLPNTNPEPGFSMSPVPWRNGQLEQNGFDEDKQDGQVSVGDETAKVIHDDDHDTDMVEITDSAPSKANLRILQDSLPFSPDQNLIGEHKQLSSTENFVDERPDKRNSSRLEPSDSSGKLSKLNSKKSSDKKGLYENSVSAKKRMKSGSSTQPQIFMRGKEAIFSESPHYSSPDQLDQDLQKDQTLRMTDRVVKGGTVDSSLQRGHGLDMPGRSVSDAHHLGQRTGDPAAQGSASDMVERPRKHVENSNRGVKQSERSSYVMDDNGSTFRSTLAREKFCTTKDKVIRETQDDDGNTYEKSLANNVRQVDVGDKLSTPLKSQYRKQGEQFGRLKDAGQMVNSRVGPYLKEDNRTDVDRSPVVNGKVLRRELSELELGELREPIYNEEALGFKKRFEKKNSFKLSENKSISLDNLNSDSSKGKTAGRTDQDSRKRRSPDSLVGVPNNQEDSLRKRITEDDDEESIMPQQRIMLPQAQHHADSEVGPQPNKSAELGVRLRNNEAQRNQVIGQEGYANTNKKATTNVSQQHETKHEGRTVGLNSVKDSKFQKSNAVIEVNGRKDFFGAESTNNGPKRTESSSDDDSPYSKFEKDEPELKGPIKDLSQYKEYVQEYLEKYDSYCSLNKSLESYRNDFSKLGQDLRLTKDGDPERYLNILEQLKENYHKCGKRHKRLKKIFIVLHEELKHLKQRIKEFALTHERE